MPFVVLFFVLVSLVAVAIVVVSWLGTAASYRKQGIVRGRRPPKVAVQHDFPPGTTTWTGGVTVGWLNAGWPMGRLQVDPDYACIGIRGRRSSAVWIPRAAVTGVKPVRTFFAPGIRFLTADGAYDGVVFWMRKRERALEALKDCGWPV
jgi:hypothetical protein